MNPINRTLIGKNSRDCTGGQALHFNLLFFSVSSVCFKQVRKCLISPWVGLTKSLFV